MPSDNSFTTSAAQKQAEIISRTLNLYKSNPKGHGFAVREGIRRDENNNKWKPNAKWVMKTAGEAELRAHLQGVRFLGLGPNLDNATATWGCIDVDQLEGESKYEMDLAQEIGKLKKNGLDRILVPDRSKNGGFHLKAFFSEPLPCVLIRRFFEVCESILGYAGCEIFPKQTGPLEKPDDCPNWVFIPYGPTWEVFAEQCGMSESGNALTIEEYLDVCEKRLASKKKIEEFLEKHFERRPQSGNGAAKIKTPKGVFVLEGATILEAFKGGPPCLWVIAEKGCPDNQHNFLLDCITFGKRKYSDNWKDFVTWVNFNVLHPRGDPEKLVELFKTHKDSYLPRCKEQPMCSHCDSRYCRTQPYGVGRNAGPDLRELGLTIINKDPREFFANIGDKRVRLDATELWNIRKFQERCVQEGARIPFGIKKDEWEQMVSEAIENGTMTEPHVLDITRADQRETLEIYLGIHVRDGVRKDGERYMEGGIGENVRIRQGRIYLKWETLKYFCIRYRNDMFVKEMRKYVMAEFEYHTQGPGSRDWYRCSYSVPFEKFDQSVIDKWLNPEYEEQTNVVPFSPPKSKE
jgi:hypothetical protein